MDNFEETLVQSVKDAITEAIACNGTDLLSDMVHDNPDWWAEEAHKAVKTTLELAVKHKELTKEIIKEFLEEYDVYEMLRVQINDTLHSMITPDLILKAAKDAMKGE